jgi:predicted secreted Zn-dependent protease
MDFSRVTWRKSSHSTGNGGECVEVAATEALRLARDSKNPDGPVLAFTSHAWNAFMSSIKAGEHDLR